MVGFGVTVVVEGPGSDALVQERLLTVKQAHSRTIQTSGANFCGAGRITADAREKGELLTTMPRFRVVLQNFQD